MLASDFTFGIEIECLLPEDVIDAQEIRIGGYGGAGNQVPGLPVGWRAKEDGSLPGSIRLSGDIYNGIEIVSPILKGIDGLRQVSKVLAVLRSWRGRVNKNCGFHVHVGWGNDSIKDLKKLVNLVAFYEKALYAASGTQARERGGYCYSIKEKYRHISFWRGPERCGLYSSGERYHSLNLMNLVLGNRKTVEFRVFSGTLNTAKAIGYVQMCLALAQRATQMSKPCAWEGAERDGYSKMDMFFIVMGWKRDGGEVIGVLQPLEGDHDFPAFERVRDELVRLARQYDGVETADVTASGF
jgi:hypothetical protein